MKRTLTLAGIALMAGMAFVGCNSNKKTTADVEVEATELTEEVKSQAIDLFKNVKIETDNIMQEIEVLPDGIRIIPVKYFLPLDWADNAQTLWQKCAMLGCYVVDAQYDKLHYGSRNDADARRAVIAKLFAEANLAAENTDLDSLSSLGNDAYITAVQNLTLNNFEKALESNQADNQLTVLIYSLVESTLNQEFLNEQRGDYDQMTMIEDMKKGEKAMTSVLQLIELMHPYYQSLDAVMPLAEKIKNVLEAEDEMAKDAAYMEYNGYIKQLRGSLNAQLEE